MAKMLRSGILLVYLHISAYIHVLHWQLKCAETQRDAQNKKETEQLITVYTYNDLVSPI